MSWNAIYQLVSLSHLPLLPPPLLLSSHRRVTPLELPRLRPRLPTVLLLLRILIWALTELLRQIPTWLRTVHRLRIPTWEPSCPRSNSSPMLKFRARCLLNSNLMLRRL